MNQINKYFQKIKVCQMLKAVRNTEIFKMFRKMRRLGCARNFRRWQVQDNYKLCNFSKCENQQNWKILSEVVMNEN
jgi:hypothetical protein